jgi:two-component system cell cycle sensor histidine kinase PleC
MPSQSASSANDVRAQLGRDLRRNTQKTVIEARQKLTSSSGTRADFDLELMLEYAGSRLIAALPISAIVVILAVVASFWVPFLFTAIWAAMVLLGLLTIVLLSRRFRLSDPAKFNAEQWTTSFVAAETVYGIAWSLIGLFPLVADAEALAPVMFAMVLVAVASNAVATRTLPPATLMSTLPVALTVSAYLIAQGGTLNYTLAAVVLCGEIFFVYLARQLHTSELETISHQAEKDSLIAELEEARHMSDEARRHAEQANIAKSQFLATMSHELRTPLNAIIGFSEVLKSELLGPHQVPQYKEYAADIHGSGQHLLNLINELLDLSRIEAGKYELSEEAVSLVDIAEDCRRMMELRAKAKGIELTFSYGNNLPKLWGDERAIRQVMLNLLSNAIKFTPQSGKVVCVVNRSADGGQLISVKDNGPGIPEDEIETVLASFGQGSLAQKTAEQGAGLGLPIVQKIMDLHQGRFDLFSKLRFGTEVIATFPRARVMDALAPIVERRNKLEIYSQAG